MKRELIKLLLIASFALPLESMAQMMHVVIFAHTTDKSIGLSTKVDMDNVADKFQLYSKLIGYDIEIIPLDGEYCTSKNVKQAIDNMFVEPNDVIITYYSGHGAHAGNDRTGRWPHYCMNNVYDPSLFLSMETLSKWVFAKNARLSIVMADCCNSYSNMVVARNPYWNDGARAVSTENLDRAKLKALFSSKGTVMMTSSKSGQVSYGSDKNGGYFTNEVLDAIYRVGRGQLNPTWNAVADRATTECGKIEHKDDQGKITHQNPDCQVNVGGSANGSSNQTTPTPVPQPQTWPNMSSIYTALTSLTDKSKSEERRLELIPQILSRYFSYGAKVVTIANDLKTQCDIEDAEVFLRRICLSPYIKGVTVIDNDKSMMKVHKIR